MISIDYDTECEFKGCIVALEWLTMCKPKNDQITAYLKLMQAKNSFEYMEYCKRFFADSEQFMWGIMSGKQAYINDRCSDRCPICHSYNTVESNGIEIDGMYIYDGLCHDCGLMFKAKYSLIFTHSTYEV